MDHGPSRLGRYGAVLLLWCFFAQAMLAARATSITLDEPLHITSGYACLLTGDYRLVEEHPPFLKMLQAAPLLLARPRLADPRSVPGWESGDLIEVSRHVVVAHRPIDPLVFAARVPTMLVGVLLGAFICRWAEDLARRWFRRRLGCTARLVPLLATLLYAFDPNMLAHAAVAATDLGAATTIFIAMYAFWRWLRSPQGHWTRTSFVAVALGLALGTKNTALMLGPVFAVIIGVVALERRAIRRTLTEAVIITAGAALVLWCLYGFEFGRAAGIPVPIPAPSHLLPLLRLQKHMREGHSAFLLGENYHHGDWRYFPVALLLKTPPLTLVLAMWAGMRGLWLGWKRRRRTDVSLLVLSLVLFPTLYFATSLASGINIGYRHLLPILPFLYVGIAGCAATRAHRESTSVAKDGIYRSTRRRANPVWYASRAVGCCAMVGYVAVTLSLHPWHLAYFNLLVGGPDGGYRYLVDSNLDWGQTWKALRAYLDAEEVESFYMSSYTINEPHAYGLDYEPLPPWPEAPPVLPQRLNPPAGIYVISTTQLQGVVVADPEMFDFFRKLEPAARIGHAMFVYDLPASPVIDWVAQCVVPVPLLPDEALREGLGLGDDTPHLTFDCEQSWLVPPGNGRYVLPLTQTDEAWPPVSPGRLAYEQTRTGFVPPFAIYESPSGGSEATTDVQPSVCPSIGGIVTFVGYRVPLLAAGQTAQIETWWRVDAYPLEPLSFMAHVLGPGDEVVAVGDGLGVPVEHWLPESLLIQRHTLTIPADVRPGAYDFHVGAYTFPDVRRLPVSIDGIEFADHFVAGSLVVVAP